MGSIARKTTIGGVPLVLCVITGIAHEDDQDSEGRFWLIQEDGRRVEIKVLRQVFTPRFAERVWVLLYKKSDEQRFGRYLMAGHLEAAVPDAVPLAGETHWKEILALLTPKRVLHWQTRIAAAGLVGMLAPMLVVGPMILLAPAQQSGLVTGALVALSIAGLHIASRLAARYFAKRLEREAGGSLTPGIRQEMFEAARELCAELEGQGVVR